MDDPDVAANVYNGMLFLVGGAVTAWAWWQNRPAPQLWTKGILEGLEKLGLRPDAFGATSAEGPVEGVELHLAVRWMDHGRELTLRVLEPLTSDLALAPEASAGSAQDLRVGDPVFDRVVRVTSGDPARALAILDPATRDLVTTAVSNGARLTPDGWVRTWLVTTDAPWGPEVARTARAVARAHLAIVRALPRRPIEGTVERLRSDRSPAVRRHALEILGERGLATRKVLEPSLADLDPELRLSVATRLEAWDVVRELVRTGSRTWRVRAAAQLAAEPGRIPPGAHDELVDVLIAALTDPELATVGADVLARIGGPQVIPALTEAAASGPVAAREAARTAAAAVRARHAHAAGGLALAADAEIGALSVAEPGRLAVAETGSTGNGSGVGR